VPEPADTCRTVDLDGTPVHVRGTGEPTPQEREFLAAIVAAARRRYAADTHAAVARASKAEAALDRVRALHQPVKGLGYRAGGSYGHIEQACTTCGTSGEYAIPWPCDTIRAIDHPDPS
jgi:hypothetical protein